MTKTTTIRFEDWETEQMKDPAFRVAAAALEPAYQVARLRMMQGLTQKELAKQVETKQSSIARLESGKHQPTLSFLQRVVEALGGRLEVHILAEGERIPLCEEILQVSSQPAATADFQLDAEAYPGAPKWRAAATATA